ncbi:MAG TPA: PQQ-dependent sugar dehydrogenase [Candidatus Eisenbacteria bacterium]|nr:PQQ-dependent sugar dehydrogenase [Candidatus Eisenbacteria bacterium]
MAQVGSESRPAAGLLSRIGLLVALFAACTASTSPGVSVGPTSAPPASPTIASGSPAPAPASPNVSGVTISLEPYATVEGGPLAIVAPPDGTGRLFVASQDGLAWVVDDGTTSAVPLLDVRNNFTTGGERGLLGLAVHPRYPTDPRIFVDYTDANGDTVVSSFRINAALPDRVLPDSESVILQVKQPAANHNGGAIVFGPDGYLYISLGDGGGGNSQNGQALDTLLGKILRIDVDAPGAPYGIPPDNPFTSEAGAKGEIWLWGLRNPWRTSFDRDTGDFWIGDVGASAWEEVDVIRAGGGGENLGWDVMEGAHCAGGSSCNTDGLMLPVAEYGHDQGCTVIGGAVYRGATYPMLRGLYLFNDACSGTAFAIDAATTTLVTPTVVGTFGGGSVSFGQDQAGELYVANLDAAVSRVVGASR